MLLLLRVWEIRLFTVYDTFLKVHIREILD